MSLPSRCCLSNKAGHSVRPASASRVFIPPALNPAAMISDGGGVVHDLRGETMGTGWSVRLVAPVLTSLAPLRLGIERIFADVIAQMSHWEAGSLLSRFNAASGGEAFDLPTDFSTVLDCALHVARQSDGACDPTIAPLVDLWGFGAHAEQPQTPPLPQAIDAALADCGWQRLPYDPARHRLVQSGGMRLDFSGIAKGHAVDLVVRYLSRAGIRHHLVEIGGELRGTGTKPDGQPWWVALHRPPEWHGVAQSRIALHDLGMATSGDYQRCFHHAGRLYGHTIDPRSGWPAMHGLASVSVLHASCMWADAYATALTVLGLEAGMDFARRHDLPVLFVSRRDGGYAEDLSPALQAMLD